MNTRDKLIYDLNKAHAAKDWTLFNQIIDALIEMDERDGRKSEWERQGKVEGATTKQN